MAGTLQAFLARGIDKAVEDLVTAIDRLPEDRRAWSPMGDARTALDMLAEVAILNGATADVIVAKTWTMGDDFGPYMAAKAELVKDEAKCRALLAENTAKVIKAVSGVPDSDLDIEIEMPWMKITMAQNCAYPYWNTCYHEGQINYIASMLGVLN